MKKINIINDSNAKIRERLILIRRESPYIFQRNFEKVVRQKISENFDSIHLDIIESHFIKFIKNPKYSFYLKFNLFN
jgi:hypothetical protein